MPIVDVHAHCVPEAALEAFRSEPGRLGVTVSTGASGCRWPWPRRAGRGPRPTWSTWTTGSPRWTPRASTCSVLSPWMNLAATAVGREHAIDLARVSNDALAEVASGQPDRLVALANLPLQDPDRAAHELRRAVGDLGMVGAEIATRPDDELDDASLEVLWAGRSRAGLPVLVHPHRSLQGAR